MTAVAQEKKTDFRVWEHGDEGHAPRQCGMQPSTSLTTSDVTTSKCRSHTSGVVYCSTKLGGDMMKNEAGDKAMWSD